MTIAVAYHYSVSPTVESVADMDCDRLYEMINRFYRPYEQRFYVSNEIVAYVIFMYYEAIVSNEC